MLQVNNILCSTGAVVSCSSVENMKFDSPLLSLLGNSIIIAEPSRYKLDTLPKEIETATRQILDSFSQS